MRYWIYKDAQIVGPYTREDLSQVQGMTPDALVCAEQAGGLRDGDWKSAAEIGELAGLFAPGAAVAAAPAREIGSRPEDAFDRFREEVRGVTGFGFGGEWTSGVFEDPEFLQQWGALVDAATHRSDDLQATRMHNAALEKSLEEMKARLAEQERRQNEILDRLNLKDRALEEKDRLLGEIRARLPGLEKALEATQEELRQAKRRLGEPQPAQSPAAWAPPAAAKTAPEPFAPPAAARPMAAPPVSVPSAAEAALPSAPAVPASLPSIGVPDERPVAAVPSPAPAPAAAPPAPLERARPVPGGPAPRLPEAALETPLAPHAPEPSRPIPRYEPPMPTRLRTASRDAHGVPFEPPSPAEAAAPVAEAAAPVAEAAAPVAEAAAPAVEPVPADAWPAMPALSPRIDAAPGGAEPPADVSLDSGVPASAAVEASAGPAAASEAPPAAPSLAEGRVTPFPDLTAPPEPAPGGSGLVELSSDPSLEVPDPQPPADGGWGAPTPAPATLSPLSEPPRTMIRALGSVVPEERPAAAPVSGATPAPLSPPPASEPPLLSRPPLRRPPPTTAAAPESAGKRRQSKAFLLVLGSAFVGLLVAAVFFLKDPKDVVQLFTMGPKRRQPVDPETLAGPVGGTRLGEIRPQPAAPAGAAAAAAPAPVPAAGGAPPAAAGGRDFIADGSLRAIEFVKKHPLGERGTIASWLQYSFLAPGNEEEWSAGAWEPNVYLVSYRAFKGGRTSRAEPITYLFEADLAKKTVVARNPAAKELLAGGAARPARSARKPAKKAARRSRPAPAPAEPEQLALPGTEGDPGSGAVPPQFDASPDEWGPGGAPSEPAPDAE